MWSILADLFVGVFDFILDVLLLRRVRSKRGRRERSMSEDAFQVARFDFVTMIVIGMACAGLMLLLSLGFGLPAGLSIGIGIAVGVGWGTWRYLQLLR
jgi:hypothetical protein